MRKLLLVCMIGCVGTSLLVYTRLTHQYPQWDEHHYLSLAVKNLDAIHQHGIGGFKEIINTGNRQPIYPFLITLALLFTGTAQTYKLALAINALLCCLTILGTYLLARRFFSPFVSMFVAFLSGTYGNAVFYAHFTYVETAVTTAIVWTLVAVSKTKGFSNTRWTIFAGLLAATATLTRFIAPVFLAGPVLVELVYGIKQSKTNLRNALVFLSLAIMLPLILYFLPNYHAFVEYVRNNQTMGPDWVRQYRDPAMANTFSIRSIMYYFNILQQNTIIPFMLFVAGMILLAVSLGKRLFAKTNIFPQLYLLFAFLMPYAFLTFITIWKEDRFLVSIYPTMALISGIFLETLRQHTRICSVVIGLITFVTIINFFGGLFGIGPAGQRGLVDIITPRWLPHPRRIYLTPLVWPPMKEYANARYVARIIQNDWKKPRKAMIGITFDHEPFINALSSILWYEQRHLGSVNIQASSQNRSLDYLITKEPIEDALWNNLETFTIPYDNSTAHIYKRISN